MRVGLALNSSAMFSNLNETSCPLSHSVWDVEDLAQDP